MSTDEPKQFLNQFYPLDVLQRRVRLINDLVRFILRGCESRYGKLEQHPASEQFRMSVNSFIFAVYNQHSVEIAKRVKMNAGDDAELLIDAFKSSAQLSGITLVEPPAISDEAVDKAFALAFGIKRSSCEEAKPSVRGAYQMARANLARAETRQVALAALETLVKPMYGRDVELTGSGALRAHLYAQRNDFLRNIVCFGSLLGGKARTDSIRLLVNYIAHDPGAACQYSVMHFLQPDGVYPGRYLTATEEAFRTDIEAKYEAL